MAFKVIANPKAGRGKVMENIPKIERNLQEKGVDFDLQFTHHPKEATDIAARASEQDWNGVIAVGGDGTVREVLSGLVGTETPLGLIPSGMGNDFARSLGIPENIQAAVEICSDPTLGTLDVGIAGDQYFGGVLGFGFPVEVMERVNYVHHKYLRGSLGFLLAVLEVISRLKSYHFSVEIEGRKLIEDLSAVFIMNTPYTGGGMRIIPEANPMDGVLDMALIGDLGRLELAMQLPRVYRGTHTGHPDISIHRASSITVATESGGTLPIMLDGDVKGNTPVEVKVRPGGVTVLLPSPKDTC